MNSQARRETFDDIPNEILFEVLRWLDAGEPKHFPLRSKQFRVFCPLSRVNRRLRAIALGFLRHKVICGSIGQLQRVIKQLERDWEADPCSDEELEKIHGASLVRSIPIGRPNYHAHPGTGLADSTSTFVYYPTSDAQIPFPRLTSFEIPHIVPVPSLLRSLEHCPELRNLVLAWDNSVSFRKLGKLSGIDTLRLYSHTGWIMGRPRWNSPLSPECIPSYDSITTLAVRNGTSSSTSTVLDQCMKLSFPNLRVLRLENANRPIPLVFDFIQRHSTILEANVHFTASLHHCIRLEALFALIHGTDTWIVPTGSMIVPSIPQVIPGNPVPDSSEYFGPFCRFAFSRVSISPAATEHRSSVGSAEPRYKCTGFATVFGDNNEDYTDEYESLEMLLPVLQRNLPFLQ